MKDVQKYATAVAVISALSVMLGCIGLSAGGTGTQSLGQLSATPASISFGNVQIGASQNQTDMLTNIGQSKVTISQMTVNGAGFAASGLTLPLTLTPGQSVNFNVVLDPKSAGSVSGSIALTNDGSSSPVTVSLSGTGVAAGNLTTNPSSLTFSNVQVGTSQTQTETLKNTGGTSLTVTAASASGPGFSITGLSLPLTLAPNQSSTFGVQFAPGSAGTSNGTLSITVSGSSTTVDVALSGTGVTPGALTATPASMSFSGVTAGTTQTQTESVQNTGGTNVTISQVTVAGTGFSISSLGTPVTLTPGQSVSFTVTFAPQSSGNYSGSVAVASNGSNPTLSVSLSGTATGPAPGQLSVSPTTINVGSVTVGTSGTQTGTLSATGASVTVSAASVGNSEFNISGLAYPVTIPAGQSAQFTVTFTPQASGVASTSASFTSNASNTPTGATLTGTGVAAPVHTVALSWSASTSSGVLGYNIYRAVYNTATSTCGSFSQINSTLNTGTSYTDTVVVDGTAYCYATTAVNSSNQESGYSNIVSNVQIPAP
jgi:hypothetical protein